MRDAYPAVVEFLDAVDEINTLIARGLAPLQKRARRGAANQDPRRSPTCWPSPPTDPLSLTAQDVKERITAIARDVERDALPNSPNSLRCRRIGPRQLAATARDWTHCGTRHSMRHRSRARVERKRGRRSASGARRRRTGPARSACGRSPHRIPPPCGRCGTRSTRHCASCARTKNSRRACSTVATN